MIPTPKRLWSRNDSHLFLGWPWNDPNQFLKWNGIPSRKKPLLMVKKSWPTNQPMYMQISSLLVSRIWRLLGEHPLHFYNLWAGSLVEVGDNFLLPLVLLWFTCGKSTCEVDEKKMTRQLYRVRFPVYLWLVIHSFTPYKNVITCIFLFHRRVLRDKWQKTTLK